MSSFTCKCGVIQCGTMAALWIDSPCTGRRCVVQPLQVDELPQGIKARIAAARGSASFTLDELRTFKAVSESEGRQATPEEVINLAECEESPRRRAWR